MSFELGEAITRSIPWAKTPKSPRSSESTTAGTDFVVRDWERDSAAVISAIGRLSDAALREVAKYQPVLLAEFLSNQEQDPVSLIRAAEAAAEMTNSHEAIRCLVPLLDHPRSIVRESAVLALAAFVENPRVLVALERVALDDESDAVRVAAADVIASV